MHRVPTSGTSFLSGLSRTSPTTWLHDVLCHVVRAFSRVRESLLIPSKNRARLMFGRSVCSPIRLSEMRNERHWIWSVAVLPYGGNYNTAAHCPADQTFSLGGLNTLNVDAPAFP